jgi:hypothetical protein
MEKGIVYKTSPETTIYDVSVNYSTESKKFYAECSTAHINGKEYLLHNEVSFGFILNDKKEIEVTGGWHIGTEDFTFSKEEGDDCEKYIEDYHPGLLKQLKDKLKELEYI